ncbi:uncharacterized protein LOC141696422 [Apium graveolens]|uniref:uncharacterized protein LOC141696422 n=1 Tax=Apium graveolens TaxID=4045 RepID=UPI003D78B5E4
MQLHVVWQHLADRIHMTFEHLIGLLQIYKNFLNIDLGVGPDHARFQDIEGDDPEPAIDGQIEVTVCAIFEEKMYDSLSSIDSSRTTWKIKVRITRMWTSTSASKEEKDALKGYNLLLLDDDDFHMHAFVYADNWRSVGKDIVEGDVYVIRNFYTREAKGTMKPTTSKYLINFSNSMTVQKLIGDDFMISRHKFEFVDLGELFSIASGYENIEIPEFATYIIGVVEDFEPVILIDTMFGKRDIVKFQITDGRYSHKVSVWGQLVVETNKNYEKAKKDHIVIAIEEGYKPAPNTQGSSIPSSPVHVIETITVQQLSQKTNSDDFEKTFMCSVKIYVVEESENWWYLSCIKYEEYAYKYEGRYKCSKCSYIMSVPVKRYKIVILAGDSNEAFNFVLMDKPVKRMVGQTATKMILDNPKTEDGYPKKIKDIAGKEVTFVIQITDDNMKLESQFYKVIDCIDKDYSISSPSDATMDGFAVSSSSENMVDLSNYSETPGSVHSTSKKIKMEK